MEKFIGKNKRVISLPVPLDTELFIAKTTCGDFCMFQKENFDKLVPKSDDRCSHDLPCHTKILAPQKVKLDINNISILREWKTRVFITEEEALDAAKEIVKNNIKILEMHGIKVREDGYSEITKKEEN